MSIPKTMNVSIVQGRDFTRRLIFYQDYDAGTLLDITGYSFKSQVREHQDRDSTLLAEFTITVDTGTSSISMALEDTKTKDIPIGISWWDLAVTEPSGLIFSYLAGQVICRGGATEV